MRNRASLSAAEGLLAELLYMAATYERIGRGRRAGQPGTGSEKLSPRAAFAILANMFALLIGWLFQR
jgi:hypothetical protein